MMRSFSRRLVRAFAPSLLSAVCIVVPRADAAFNTSGGVVDQILRDVPAITQRALLLRVGVDGALLAADSDAAVRAFIVARCEADPTDHSNPCHRLVFGPVLVGPVCATEGAREVVLSDADLAGLVRMAFATAIHNNDGNNDGNGDGNGGRVITPSGELLGSPSPLESVLFQAQQQQAVGCTLDPFSAFQSSAIDANERASRSTADGVVFESPQQLMNEASDLDALGLRGLIEAQRIVVERRERALEPTAITGAEAQVEGAALAQFVLTVPLSPTADALGFVAWCTAVDGEQALLRARGDIAAADRRVRDLRSALTSIGADVAALRVSERVPAGSTEFRSFTFVDGFPFEAWTIACTLSAALERRHRAVETLLALAAGIAIDAGLLPEAIKELTKRIRQMEASLPPGFNMTNEFEAAITKHLAARFSAELKSGIDVVQARTAVWELFAAAWNMQGALPEQVRTEREAQRSELVSQFMDGFTVAFGKIPIPGLADQFRSTLRSEIDSPFQACLLYPADEVALREARTQLANSLEHYAESVMDFLGPELQEDPDKNLVWWEYERPRRIAVLNQINSHQFMFEIVGAYMYRLDRGVSPYARTPRAHPFFGDADVYWSTASNKPPLPRLTLRSNAYAR